MRILLLSAIVFFSLAISPAQAQESSEFCGIPDPAEMDTEALGHCDIYQRQLAYREEALKLRALMEERQENYATPRREALRRYEADMEALNKQRTSEDF